MITEKISSIQFGIFSPEQIKEMATAKIMTSKLYDADGFPVKGGLMDPRMGVISPGIVCKTCGARMGECTGHFGYIDLARPLINVIYAKYVYKILKSICDQCSRVLLGKKERKEFEKKHKSKLAQKRKKRKLERLRWTYDNLKKRCPFCKKKKKEVKYEKPTTYYVDDEELTPVDLREKFERIPKEDLKFLGFSQGLRPEWMILTLLLVPPPNTRPSITLESGQRAEDDLTHKLADIVRINQRLYENLDAGAPDVIIEDLWGLLQYHTSTYLDNTLSKIPPARHRSGRALKTLKERLKGKDGRFRKNLAGKRVNFSSRSVISPDPYIKMDEVGIPEQVARELTVPERVNRYNLEKMKKLVTRGSKKLEGANYVIRLDGKRKKVTEENKKELARELEPGYQVERHLRDGDIAVFNRQPSLHRMSMMGHRVRVLPYKTFRINLTVCPSYNADFDGDEMNLHIPQTEEARTEAQTLLLASKHIRSPRYGKSIMGCIQDFIIGSYFLTQEGNTLPKKEAEELLINAGLDPDLVAEKEKWTGKEIFSFLLPTSLSMGFRSSICPNPKKPCKDCPNNKKGCTLDAKVDIKEGKLLSGRIDENSIGTHGSGKIVDQIAKEHGSRKAKEFLDRVTKLALTYLMKKGFTISLDQLDISKKTRTKATEAIRSAEEKVSKLIDTYEKGEIKPGVGRSARETLETKILNEFNKGAGNVWKLVTADLDPRENSVLIMALTGAKGSKPYIGQMAGCVGQQVIRGKRLDVGYIGRTLSHFKKGDLRGKARGFISSNLRRGLDPIEFFYLIAAGRDSMINKAVVTPTSGYFQRRLLNALQDLKIEYDETVRDSSGTIIQFTYGEDGIDPTKSDSGVLSLSRIR